MIFCVEKLHDFFWWTGCVIFFVKWLRDFFFVWRGCVIFVCSGCVIFLTYSLTHSLRLHDFFSGVCMICFSERLRDILVERLHDFLCEEVP